MYIVLFFKSYWGLPFHKKDKLRRVLYSSLTFSDLHGVSSAEKEAETTTDFNNPDYLTICPKKKKLFAKSAKII